MRKSPILTWLLLLTVAFTFTVAPVASAWDYLGSEDPSEDNLGGNGEPNEAADDPEVPYDGIAGRHAPAGEEAALDTEQEAQLEWIQIMLALARVSLLSIAR